MATFHFLPFSAEVFDCVLCVICFLGMDSLVTFLSYKCRVFAKASHVFLIMMAASKDLFIMMKMIEYLFGLGGSITPKKAIFEALESRIPKSAGGSEKGKKKVEVFLFDHLVNLRKKFA